MKHYLIISVLLVVVLSLCATPAFSQAMGSVKGVCKDQDGNPTGQTATVKGGEPDRPPH